MDIPSGRQMDALHNGEHCSERVRTPQHCSESFEARCKRESWLIYSCADLGASSSKEDMTDTRPVKFRQGETGEKKSYLVSRMPLPSTFLYLAAIHSKASPAHLSLCKDLEFRNNNTFMWKEKGITTLSLQQYAKLLYHFIIVLLPRVKN